MEERDLSNDNPADPANAPMRPNERDEYNPVEDMADVRQDEDPGGPTVPVCVKETVRVQQLPSLPFGSRAYPLTATEAVRVLTADPRRRRAVFHATGDDNTVLAASQKEAMGPYAGTLQSFAVLELTTCGEVWARAETTTVTLSVWDEPWAE